jgi:hypothetical protein
MTQIFANIATVIAMLFVAVQLNQSGKLVDVQIENARKLADVQLESARKLVELEIESDKKTEVYNRSMELAVQIDNEMSAFTLTQSDKSLSDIDTLKFILKSLRTISILGAHIENEGIDSDIVYPLIGRHGLGLYEKSIYDFVESKHISKWEKEENDLILTIMNVMSFNINNIRTVQNWSNQQRSALVDKQIEKGHIKYGAVKKTKESE